MSGMTSRKRVLASLRHQEVDRVPIDFGAMRSTGIVVQAYDRLKKHLGLMGKTKLYDVMQWLAEPEEEVLRIMGGDVIQLHRWEPCFGINISSWRPWRTPDGIDCIVPQSFDPVEAEDGSLELWHKGLVVARMPRGGFWFDQVWFPLAHATTYADIDRHEFPVISDEEVDYLSREAKRLHENTNYAILGAFGGNIFEGGHFDFGYQRFMTLLAEDPKLAEYYMDKLADSWIEQLKRYLPAVKDYIHVIQLGDDLGMQSGLQISPRVYRTMIKPYHASVYRYIKENSNLFIFLHSCGGFYELIPDLIEIGVDIINPVQISAAGMEPRRLKKEFGKDLTFWGGGCNTQTTLTHGNLKEIEQEVRELISIFAPGGGFVFTQVHNIQSDITPEKIIIMYKTAQEYGEYPV